MYFESSLKGKVIMKVKFISFIVSLFLIIGCSHSYVLTKESKSDFESLFNKRASGKKGEIITKDNKRIKAKNIQVSNDTAFWKSLYVPKMYKVALNEVQKILVTGPHPRAKGLIYGALIGFAIGGTIGLISGDDPSAGQIPWIEGPGLYADEKAVILGTVFGLTGGMIGAIAAPTVQDEFIIDEKTSRKYYLLRDVQISDETETSIQIQWQGKMVWLNKSEVIIRRIDDGADIRIPVEIYRNKFGK